MRPEKEQRGRVTWWAREDNVERGERASQRIEFEREVRGVGEGKWEEERDRHDRQTDRRTISMNGASQAITDELDLKFGIAVSVEYQISGLELVSRP